MRTLTILAALASASPVFAQDTATVLATSVFMRPDGAVASITEPVEFDDSAPGAWLWACKAKLAEQETVQPQTANTNWYRTETFCSREDFGESAVDALMP